jgi:hypothetical protein
MVRRTTRINKLSVEYLPPLTRVRNSYKKKRFDKHNRTAEATYEQCHRDGNENVRHSTPKRPHLMQQTISMAVT